MSERREIHISAFMTNERVDELLKSATHDDMVVMDYQSYRRGVSVKVPAGVRLRVLQNPAPISPQD